ncbi:PREDICTED: uncharacterized protein LOC104594796 [Nelumbo nucifera]|uniref:Uncharacterized protein LOC104594796 n=2 Tax=Nelumbo nucifera TaxID=4432 RepID=A0A1U7ZI80_NELNU|nr:PREDICTED: uncharacterized protein LOC104594796 [Nelumbo nucifera]DAD26112.1 TPA_asm: hypothetical protein HUJ06_027580 [Nelumbo nucifera]
MMELKTSAAFITLLLLSILLARSNLSEGGSDATVTGLDREVYEIDYRGPETHSYNPPPKRSGGRPFIHHGSTNMHHPSYKLPRAHTVKDERSTVHIPGDRA